MPRTISAGGVPRRNLQRLGFRGDAMIKDVEGHWDVAVVLPQGRYEFKFVVDGVWCCESGCNGTNRACPKCVSNPFGTMNRLIEVT